MGFCAPDLGLRACRHVGIPTVSDPLSKPLVIEPNALQFVRRVRPVNAVHSQGLGHKTDVPPIRNPEPHLPISGSEVSAIKFP
jgi:hypothetical protein